MATELIDRIGRLRRGLRRKGVYPLLKKPKSHLFSCRNLPILWLKLPGAEDQAVLDDDDVVDLRLQGRKVTL
jgi:hypothetical protein